LAHNRHVHQIYVFLISCGHQTLAIKWSTAQGLLARKLSRGGGAGVGGQSGRREWRRGRINSWP